MGGEAAKQAWLDALERALFDDNMRRVSRLVDRLRQAGVMYVDKATSRLYVRNEMLTRLDWAEINAVRPAFCAVIAITNARAHQPRRQSPK